MASCNDGFSPFADDDVHHHHHQQRFSSHHISADHDPSPNKVSAAGESDADSGYPGGDESDQIRDSSGGRGPYYYKKLKPTLLNGAGSESACVDYRKDREEWSDAAISSLLDVYIDKYTQLNRGNLRGRDWEVVAEMVNEKQKSCKSVEQCKNKIDNLKKRFKVEVQRISSGGTAVSSWHWFKKMEEIVGNSPSVTKCTPEDDRTGIVAASAAAVVGNGIASSSSFTSRHAKRYSPSPATLNNLKPKPAPKWKRVVFKISGGALVGSGQNIDPKIAMQIANEVATACQLGVEVAIVTGGSNFFCGTSWVSDTGFDRPTAYQIGMMATVMNSILLQSALEKSGVQARVQTAFALPEVAEPYSKQRAIRHLEKGRVVIFGGIGAGTGNPLFSTDTAAALRATEINADAVLKGTNVDGVYDCRSGDAGGILVRSSYREIISGGVAPMDLMAITFCEESGTPVVIFNMLEPGNITKALCGNRVGTLIDIGGRIS
uniref:UMP kinase n=1 Tax=Kalanchoe fedtschenkoi TaxID=63787 RepID=A0A7N0V3R4_KALFE